MSFISKVSVVGPVILYEDMAEPGVYQQVGDATKKFIVMFPGGTPDLAAKIYVDDSGNVTTADSSWVGKKMVKINANVAVSLE